MAREVFLTRIQNNCFAPADEESLEVVSKIKLGLTVRAAIVQPRNIKFHNKFFALLGLGYQHWEPAPQEWKGIKAVKTFEPYREQITIMAGYREVTFNLDGSVKVTAKSIAFANMDDIMFGMLYSSAFKVIWYHVLSKCEGWTIEEMKRVLDQLESYT